MSEIYDSEQITIKECYAGRDHWFNNCVWTKYQPHENTKQVIRWKNFLDYDAFNLDLLDDIKNNKWIEEVFQLKHLYDIKLIKDEHCAIYEHTEKGTHYAILGCLIIEVELLETLNLNEYLTIGSLIHMNAKETYSRSRKIYKHFRGQLC